MPVFPVISLKNRWAIRLGQRWSEPIGVLTAYRRREIMETWANFCSGKPVGRKCVSIRRQRSNTRMSRHRAFALYDPVAKAGVVDVANRIQL